MFDQFGRIFCVSRIVTILKNTRVQYFLISFVQKPTLAASDSSNLHQNTIRERKLSLYILHVIAPLIY